MDIWHTAEPNKVGSKGLLGQAIKDLDPNSENVVTAVNFSEYLPSYKPIFITLGLVLLLTAISFYNTENTMDGFLRFFMGYFFIIFSFLKLQNVKQFAISFSNYDPITKRFFKFGIIYPFLELILGIFFLTATLLLFSNIVTLFILIPQSIGIFKKLKNNLD